MIRLALRMPRTSWSPLLLASLMLSAGFTPSVGETRPVAATQATAPQTSSDDADYAQDEELYELIFGAATINEECKSAIGQVYYDGFRVLFKVSLADLGATEDDIAKFEATATEMADYVCTDKAECWRLATGLPASATIDEGKTKCLDMLLNATEQLADAADPNAPAVP